MTRRVRIAVVDSGVHAAHPHLAGAGTIELGVAIAEDGARSREPAAFADRLGHGTAVAAAILDLAPGAALLVVKVFDRHLACPFERVLEALDVALDARPDLVNLSLGTSDPEHRGALEPRIARALELGARIVAPADAHGMPSYPGALAGVDAVVADPNLPRDRPERRRVGTREFWFASPFPREIPGVPRTHNLHGSSFATANVTGWLARARA